jgi:hypothetical protein
MSYTVGEDALVRAKIAREKQTERLLNVALPVVGMKSIEKIRELLSIYDERIYIWLAGLYDKNIGGFYFSNSARDTDGFLPDIESTAQAIRMLKSSGLFDEDVSYTDVFSSETTNKIVNFFTSRQAPDGYFYHPQWCENISSNRKQRDRRWALSSLEKFNATPNVTVPLNDGETAVNFEFLESTEEFKKHLSEIDLSKSPLSVATRLISIGTHVKRAGIDYVDELKRMGAQITVDGRVAVIEGGNALTGAPVHACDLRAGAAMVTAGLCASGTTVVEDIHFIERGYENFVGKLRALGADISLVDFPDEPDNADKVIAIG